jgi:hypothetical protein
MTRPFIGLALGICISGAIATDAISHGTAQWIQDGGYLTAMNTPCCGDEDCTTIQAATVRPLDSGRYAVITDDGTFVIGPKGVHRSIDDHYWLCRFPNQAPRCLFIPFTGGLNYVGREVGFESGKGYRGNL